MIGSLVLFCLATFLFFLFLRNQRGKNFPPGPTALPIFGNLLEFNASYPIPDLQRLAKRYGNIYSLFLGAKRVVIINGLQAMKEALINKSADFSGRPQNLMLNDAIQRKAHSPGAVLSDYGPLWKEHRRFGLMTLRNFGLGKQSMEERILQELQHTVKILEESVGNTMDPQVLFHNAASNIICQVVFGAKYDYSDKFIKLFVRTFKENSKIINGPWAMLYDTIPLVRYLPLPFRKAFKNCKDVNTKAVELVAEHKETWVPGKPRDLLDCYLDALDKGGHGSSSFSEEQLASFAQDLHFAGTDTTANTLLTSFLHLITHPQIQERCQQEIDMVLQGKDKASFEDRHQMPYTQAVIHEMQRIANTVPLSVFHCTTKDTELMGYSIPKGTIVIPNMISVLSEDGQWKFPHEFNPENFLNDQGEFVKPEAFIPFSIGPRTCLGESLARMELFLVFVTLLRKFRFVWPKDAGQPDYTPVFGVTMNPKPYRLEVHLRKIPN